MHKRTPQVTFLGDLFYINVLAVRQEFKLIAVPLSIINRECTSDCPSSGFLDRVSRSVFKMSLES